MGERWLGDEVVGYRQRKEHQHGQRETQVPLPRGGFPPHFCQEEQQQLELLNAVTEDVLQTGSTGLLTQGDALALNRLVLLLHGFHVQHDPAGRPPGCGPTTSERGEEKEVPQLQQMVMQKGETERFNEDAFTVELP